MILTLYAVLALAVLMALTVLMPWLAPFLPRDLSGPDGWFIDTEKGDGIFDWRKRR